MIDNIFMWKYYRNSPYTSEPIALSKLELPKNLYDIKRLRKVFLQVLIQNDAMFFDERIQGVSDMTLVDLISLEIPNPYTQEKAADRELIELSITELKNIIQAFQEHTQDFIKDSSDRSS